jgi:hypothetical protein
MQNPIDQAEASIPTVTVREGPRLNPMGTFTVRRKAAKRSERWRQNVTALLPPSPQGKVILSRKKPRLNKPLPTATDNAIRETASPQILVACLLPPPSADNDDENSDVVTGTQPNAGAARVTGRWTPEEDAQLTSAVAKTKKKRWGKEYKIDWVAAAALVPGRTNEQCSQRWHDVLDPSIDRTAPVRTGKWTEDEDLKLQYSVQMHGGKDWAAIAVMVPGRTKQQCNSRWFQVLDPNIDRANGRTGKWTEDEDLKLQGAVQMHGGKDWAAISALVPGRTRSQCCNRWHDVLDSSIVDRANGRMGRWTEKEDLKLKTSVGVHGGKDWAAIAVLVPDRTKKQCWQRWHDALDPSIDRATGRWKVDEDLKLQGAVQMHGAKDWARIALMVSGRTNIQCYNRWHYCQNSIMGLSCQALVVGSELCENGM